MQKNRDILKLNFGGKKKPNDPFNISVNSRELIAERQKKLKEEQKRKELEKKEQLAVEKSDIAKSSVNTTSTEKKNRSDN